MRACVDTYTLVVVEINYMYKIYISLRRLRDAWRMMAYSVRVAHKWVLLVCVVEIVTAGKDFFDQSWFLLYFFCK